MSDEAFLHIGANGVYYVHGRGSGGAVSLESIGVGHRGVGVSTADFSSSAAGSQETSPRRIRKTTLQPGHRVRHVTFVESQLGGWVCDCDCGERLFLTHAQIHTRGHCGCVNTCDYDTEGEETLAAIGAEMGLSKQRIDQLLQQARESFRAHWELWRVIMDTDLETADRPTLWKVVAACRILGAALDARAPQA